ncbi:hypothetical protein E5163_12665 [Marinicauda algicola]|uniref:SPOR domain-containing protein n=1 Tax=Marinicauda algicola TaxID=2029849 RepID=A0A4S2GXJ2_9PROT|nr:SPOR domain-containing protein [Marinicauda algicola]TGY87774.1 hypothetical protein E5163_12665 [Marinicauda algicola]
MKRAGCAHAIRGRLRQASAGLAVLALAGCASAPAPAPVPDSQAARLAALLQAAARAGDPRLETAREEMAALESALTAGEAAPQVEPQPAASLDPPPDLSRMEPVFHAAHIASYRSMDLAGRGWAIYRQDPALSGHEAVAAEVELDSGRWYRLKVGPFDTRGAAASLCAELESRGDWCAVTDFTGTALAE